MTNIDENVPPADLQRSLKNSRAFNGIVSLADQVLVSGSRFAISIVIAKSCGAVELGIYALVLTLILMALTIQQSLVTTPFANFKNRLKPDEQSAYLASIFRMSLILAVATGVLLTIVGLTLIAIGNLFHDSLTASSQFIAMGKTMVGAAAAAIPMVLAEFCRRIWFIEMKAVRSFILDLAISLGLATGVALLWCFSRINAINIYLVAAVAYGIFVVAASGVLIRKMNSSDANLRAAFGKHWHFGRWIVGSEVMALGRSNLIQWIIVGFLGIGATGIYSACLSLMRATNPFLLGIANVAEPALAKNYARAGRSEVKKLAIKIFWIMVVMTLPICLFIAVFGSELLAVIYKPEFGEHAIIVVWLAAAAFVAAISYPLSNSIQAIDRPKTNFNVRLVGLLIVVLLSLVMIPLYGLHGAAIIAFVGSAFTFSCRAYLFAKFFLSDDLIATPVEEALKS